MAYHKELREANPVRKQLQADTEKRDSGGELTPVIAVPVHAQANGSRYHGAFAIMKSPKE